MDEAGIAAAVVEELAPFERVREQDLDALADDEAADPQRVGLAFVALEAGRARLCNHPRRPRARPTPPGCANLGDLAETIAWLEQHDDEARAIAERAAAFARACFTQPFALSYMRALVHAYAARWEA